MNVIPSKMHARHIQTGEWFVLECCFYANEDFWRITNTDPVTSYVFAGLDAEYANLSHFDSFEAVQ